MSILPFPCDMPGCKKSKLRKHTHFIGDISRSGADRDLIARYAEMEKITGKKVPIPGGDVSDFNMFMAKRLKDGAKEAARFRKNLKK